MRTGLYLRQELWQNGVMFFTYLLTLWRFATHKSLSRLDAWQVVGGSAVPIFYWLMGWPMPTDNGVSLIGLLGLLVIGYACLRFLCSPYFVWKENQTEIAALKMEVAEPKKLARIRAEEHTEKMKRSLAQHLATMKNLATVRGTWSFNYSEEGAAKFKSAQIAANEIVEELSYETEIRQQSLDFMHLCGNIIIADKCHEDDRDDRKKLFDLSKALMPILHGRASD